TRATADIDQRNYHGFLMVVHLISTYVLGVMLSSFTVPYIPKRFHPPAEALLSQQVAPHGSAVWMSYALLVIGAVSTLIPPIEPVVPFIIAAATGAINGTFTRRGEVTVGLTYMTGT